jgi:hypothetical protein
MLCVTVMRGRGVTAAASSSIPKRADVLKAVEADRPANALRNRASARSGTLTPNVSGVGRSWLV